MADHQPIVLSWSALRQHEHCRQQRLLIQTGGRAPSTNIRSYFHGTVADRCMRKWLETSPEPGEGRGVMASYVDDMIEHEVAEARRTGDGIVLWKNDQDKANMAAWCRQLLTNLEPILDLYVLPFDYAPEYRFKAGMFFPGLDGTPWPVQLWGGMDILVRNPKIIDENGKPQYAVFDLKATENESYWRQTIGQLVFYDLAVLAQFNAYTSFRALIQPMCKNQVVPLNIQEQNRDELAARLERMAQFMWKRDWALKEGTEGCSYCEVRGRCPRFKIDPNVFQGTQEFEDLLA